MKQAGVEFLEPAGQLLTQRKNWLNKEIHALTDDSRQVGAKTVFLATPEGLPYLQDAARREAGVILLDQTVGVNLPSLLGQSHKSIVLLCKNLLQAQGKLASALYNHPSHSIELIGVTGTNGKTTICWLLYQIWKSLGYKAGVIGTLGAYWYNGEKEWQQQTGFTTPRSWQLQQILAKMLQHNVKRIALEASSEGLASGRLYGTRFTTTVFSGLSWDHLDYHGDMESYFQAKKILFSLCAKDTGKFVIAINNTYGKRLAEEMDDYKNLTLLSQPLVEIKQNLSFKLAPFQAWNISLALTASGLSKQFRKKAYQNLEKMPNPFPMGRYQIIYPNYDAKKDSSQPSLYGIVDYAHTPDALQNLLETVRKQCAFLVCVFGCGGQRDNKKRPLMGRVAARFCDLIILCDDNPRQEEAAQIRKHISKGIPKHCTWKEIPNRREAIYQAVQEGLLATHKPAIIVVAGKGHETHQILKEKTIPFSDVLVLQLALSEISKAESLKKYRNNSQSGKVYNLPTK